MKENLRYIKRANKRSSAILRLVDRQEAFADAHLDKCL